jgi:hypothetical protein
LNTPVEDNMNKLLVGLIVGALLGAVDGLTAWFTPQVRDQIIDIVMWSTLKGVIAGIAAGWYAKKVHSVPKGIAFGFIVGLLLAFLVAMMPDPKTGAHYWWQIMVPGSLLGGVIGWATQRYGRTSSTRGAASAIALIALCLIGFNAYGHDHEAAKPSGANAAFEKLKRLAGTHQVNQMSASGPTTKIEYRISAGGSAVFETMFAGEPHEMITVYTVDGDSVMATHFCSGGNQPVMRLNATKSNEHQLVFDFESISGTVTPNHINGVTFTFGDGGKVEESWSSNDSEHVRLFYNDAK